MHLIPNEDISWLKNKVQHIEPLSIDEEKELFHLISQGNKKARDKLIEANMKFVISVAKEYSYANLSTSDLVAEGTIGLIRAIQSFDYTRGLKFITYAVWWIRAFITRAVNEQGSLVRLPANQQLKLRQSLRKNKSGETLTEEIKKRYFIKGRPGTGKSTFLKKLAAAGIKAGYDVEIYLSRECEITGDSFDSLTVTGVDEGISAYELEINGGNYNIDAVEDAIYSTEFIAKNANFNLKSKEYEKKYTNLLNESIRSANEGTACLLEAILNGAFNKG